MQKFGGVGFYLRGGGEKVDDARWSIFLVKPIRGGGIRQVRFSSENLGPKKPRKRGEQV